MDSNHRPVSILKFISNFLLNNLLNLIKKIFLKQQDWEITSPYYLYCLSVGIKIGLACLICFFLMGYFNLDDGYCTVIPVLLGCLLMPLRIYQATWEIAIGNTLGFIIFSPLILLIDHRMLYFLFTFLGLFLCVYIPLKTKSRFLLIG